MTDFDQAPIDEAMPFGPMLGIEFTAASPEEVRAGSRGDRSSAPPAASSTAAR